MIAMGAGTNHWFHSDQVYRTFLSLVMMCGCEGVNGGGWAHYVGQEKVRPLAGWQTLAFALDWVRPPRHQSGTPFFYLATDQWRYERIQPERPRLAARPRAARGPPHRRRQRARRPARLAAVVPELRPQHARPGRRGRAGRGRAGRRTSSTSCARAGCASPARTPTRPSNHPKVMTVWRSNLLGSSGKGHEYFLKHLLGTTENAGARRGVAAGAAPARGASGASRRRRASSTC